MSDTTPATIERLEAELARSRQHLAGAIDELTRRAAPKAILQRQLDALRTRFDAATHTPTGELRTDRVAALAAAGVGLVALGIWRRRRR